MKAVKHIFLNILPVVLMIALIPFVSNDYVLALLYLAIITIALLVRYERHDILALLLGIILMTISESFFISTHVEVFVRNSLFGLMPIWLPLLWGYGFVVIKRSVTVLQ